MIPEILAPAGSVEALRAAVRNGADAVYFGAAKYNARAFAQNFEGQELTAAVAFCKRAGVKVHLTVNTLMTDREMDGIYPFLKEINEMGVDAVIVQDLGLISVIRQLCPDLAVHASTQMTLHNLDGVKFAAELGVSRVVLARELSRNEIKYITAHSPVETEMFVHGSLCVCYSGRCYMSSIIGRRSGNRGRCAQPCRMAYACQTKSGALLSLKDLSLLPYINEVIDTGVTSLKIEGRMKRPEYVAAVTRTLVRAIREKKPPATEDMQYLEKIFSRSGFTGGYFEGQKQGMHGMRGENFEDYEKLLKEERQSYEKDTPHIPVKGSFIAQIGRDCSLSLTDEDGNYAMVSGAAAEAAQSRALTADDVRDALSRLGDTPYYIDQADILVPDGAFLPKAALNALRRNAVKLLDEKRCTAVARRYLPREAVTKKPNGEKKIDLIAVFDDISNIPECMPEIKMIYIPLEQIAKAEDYGCELGVRMPPIYSDDECEQIKAYLAFAKEKGVKKVLCQNPGQLMFLKNTEFELHGDYALNIFNSDAVRVLKKANLQSALLSFELNFPQIRDISKEISCGIFLYGRIALMVTDTCVMDGCSARGGAGCHLPVKLKDRQGELFPVNRSLSCRNIIYNTKPVYLADKREDYKNLGLTYGMLYFTTEQKAEVLEIMDAYCNGKVEINEFTRALYYKGVL